MSYLVLARKWRPLSFKDLVGQESVVRTLKNALEQGRVVHAYVFSGPRGVGKTTTARILSRALNCQNGPTTEPCGNCPSCDSITNGSAVDVIEIDGASNRGINEIRELRESVRYAPSGGKYKIYIIDEVHMLTKEAFNALLKTLEEPPPHVIFIFATTSPKSIPVTVLSRCQHLNFRRIPKAKIMDHLSYICGQEKVSITPGALEMIARVAEGSVRDSLTVLDQAMAFSSDVQEQDLQTMLGLPEQSLLYNMAGLLLKADRSGLLETVRDLAEGGSDLRTFPRELSTLFRNLLVVKVSERPASLLELPEDEILDLKALAEDVNTEELTLMLNEFLRLEGEIRAAPTPRYLMELAFIRATFFKGSTSLEGILNRLESMGGASAGSQKEPPSQPLKTEKLKSNAATSKKIATTRSEPVKSVKSVKPVETAQLEPNSLEAHDTVTSYSDTPVLNEDIEKLWQRIVSQIDQKNHPLASKISAGRMCQLTDTEVEIRFDVENATFYIDSLKRNMKEIEDAAASALGRRVRVKLTAEANNDGNQTIKKPSEVKKGILDEPIVRSAIDLFDAKVLDVKPLKSYFETNGGNDV